MIHPTAILWPIAALALLTFIVLLVMPILRIRDIATGKASPRDFRYGDTEQVSKTARLINRNYMNLLELPILFYVICLIVYVSNTFSPPVLYLAWAFVAFRALHTVLHVALNHVLLRLILFAGAAACLMAMWIVTFWHVASR